jgi:hypothetical protein
MKMKPGEMKVRGKLSPSTQSMKYKNRCYRYNVPSDEYKPTQPPKPDERKRYIADQVISDY